jgi:tRNA(fMet)-specific endonuclease VapC
VVKFLLDTNVISEPPRLRPSAKLLRRLKEHEGQLAISAVTWHEVVYGLERLPAGPKKERLQAYFEVVRAALPVLPYDDRAAAWHAKERARLTKTPPFVDGQIAAIAATNGLTLVTADADFEPFDVKVVNWLE